MKRLLALLSIAIAGLAAAADEAVRVLDDAQFALVGVDLIDGTGAPLRPDMTVVVRDGRIATVGPRATTPVPEGARAIELAGHVLTPGFVLMHEHLFYPVSHAGRDYAESRGIIVADTKFEFGLDDAGDLCLIDEILTPDSSPFWPADRYQPGRSQPSFDKQPLRDYLAGLRDQGRWKGDAPPPPLPDEIVVATSHRYLEAYRLLTGLDLEVR